MKILFSFAKNFNDNSNEHYKVYFAYNKGFNHSDT